MSFVVLYLLSAPGFDNTRAYEGTDARAGGLLIGAALAMVWRPGRQRRDIGTGSRLVIDGTGLAALAVIALLVVTTNEYSLSLYSWGILSLSLATAALLAVVVHPASLVGRVIGMQPLRWIGERSYGIYLWHLPVIAFTPQEFLAERPVVRGVLQVAIRCCWRPCPGCWSRTRSVVVACSRRCVATATRPRTDVGVGYRLWSPVRS